MLGTSPRGEVIIKWSPRTFRPEVISMETTADLIEQALADKTTGLLKNLVRLVEGATATIEQEPAPNPSLESSLVEGLARDLSECLRVWKHRTVSDICETAVLALMDIAENIAPATLSGTEMRETAGSERPPVAADDGVVNRQVAGPLLGGLGVVPSRQPVFSMPARSHHSGGKAPLKRRCLIAFLCARGFSRVNGSTTEEVYEYTNGQRVWVPGKHGGTGGELRNGTEHKIVARLSEILGKRLAVLGGKLVVEE